MTKPKSLLLAAGLFSVSCTTQPVREQSPEAVAERLELDFIESNVTTRQQVLDELGEPFYEFDDGRIYAYYLTRSQGTTRAPSTVACARPVSCYSRQLILVFDESEVLTRYTYLRSAAER